MATRTGVPETLSVIMPFHDEGDTVRAAVERVGKANLQLPVEVVLVDDGSTDDGAASIEPLLGDDVRLISLEERGGKGTALRAGLEAANGDLVAILDADLEYDPADLEQMLAVILRGDAQVVYGTRTFGAHMAAHSFWYVIGNKVTTLWASLLFNTWLADIHTCLKVAPRTVWRSLGLRSRGFSIDPEATARFLKAGHRIYEVPASYRARSHDEGKKLKWTDGFGALWVVARVRLGRR